MPPSKVMALIHNPSDLGILKMSQKRRLLVLEAGAVGEGGGLWAWQGAKHRLTYPR